MARLHSPRPYQAAFGEPACFRTCSRRYVEIASGDSFLPLLECCNLTVRSPDRKRKFSRTSRAGQAADGHDDGRRARRPWRPLRAFAWLAPSPLACGRGSLVSQVARSRRCLCLVMIFLTRGQGEQAVVRQADTDRPAAGGKRIDGVGPHRENEPAPGRVPEVVNVGRFRGQGRTQTMSSGWAIQRISFPSLNPALRCTSGDLPTSLR